MAAAGAASLVSAERFKLLDVTSRQSIREFTTKHGLDFAAGKGFYELMKPELIQDYKEIVAVRRSDGSKVSGARVRELLGIPASAAKFKLDTAKLSDFKVFVQSTSYNRALGPGTQFLYDVGGGGSGVSEVAGGGGSSLGLAHERPPAPPSGAGMPIEIVFSFDTTASMSSVLSIVRSRLQELIRRLYNDIPGIRIAVFAHGDYDHPQHGGYITKHVDFTTDARKLCDFVESVESHGGEDVPECYELVLKEAREQLSWTPGTQRALVMIGDTMPHEPADYGTCSVLQKFPRVVWKDEVDAIVRQTGCRAYAVQCMNTPGAAQFWQYLAYHTHGYHLNLSNFGSVLDFILAICYREQGAEQLQAYRAEVEERQRASGGMNDELHRLFEALGVPSVSSVPAAPTAAAAVPAARPSFAAASSSSGAATRKRKSGPATAAKVAAADVRRAGASRSAVGPDRSAGSRRGLRSASVGTGASPPKRRVGAASTAPRKKASARRPAAIAPAAKGLHNNGLRGRRGTATATKSDSARAARRNAGQSLARSDKAMKSSVAGRASVARRPTRGAPKGGRAGVKLASRKLNKK